MLKKVKGSAVSEGNNIISINQRESEIDDVSISSNKTFSSNKTEQIYLKKASLVNAGNSSATDTTHTSNRINALIPSVLTSFSSTPANGAVYAASSLNKKLDQLLYIKMIQLKISVVVFLMVISI